MPSVYSKFLVWNDTCAVNETRKQNSIIPYVKTMKNASDFGFIKGKCFVNALIIARFIMLNVDIEDRKNIKIKSGIRWVKNCNDRWVGDITKDITKHFWVEFEGRVYDICYTPNGDCYLFGVDIGDYYRVRNITQIEKIPYTIKGKHLVGCFTKSSMNEKKCKFYGIEFLN